MIVQCFFSSYTAQTAKRFHRVSGIALADAGYKK